MSEALSAYADAYCLIAAAVRRFLNDGDRRGLIDAMEQGEAITKAAVDKVLKR